MASIAELMEAVYRVRDSKAALEKTEKALMAELRPLVDPLFDATPDKPLVEGNLVLVRASGVSRTISGDLLLERGVAPDIVAYATRTTTYYRYRIKEAGE